MRWRLQPRIYRAIPKRVGRSSAFRLGAAQRRSTAAPPPFVATSSASLVRHVGHDDARAEGEGERAHPARPRDRREGQRLGGDRCRAEGCEPRVPASGPPPIRSGCTRRIGPASGWGAPRPTTWEQKSSSRAGLRRRLRWALRSNAPRPGPKRRRRPSGSTPSLWR